MIAKKEDFRIEKIDSIPASKTGDIDKIISAFLKLNEKYGTVTGVAKYSVPFINKKSDKLNLGIKAVTRSGKVYLENLNLTKTAQN